MAIPEATRAGYTVGESVMVSFGSKRRVLTISEILPKRLRIRMPDGTQVVRRLHQISKT